MIHSVLTIQTPNKPSQTSVIHTVTCTLSSRQVCERSGPWGKKMSWDRTPDLSHFLGLIGIPHPVTHFQFILFWTALNAAVMALSVYAALHNVTNNEFSLLHHLLMLYSHQTLRWSRVVGWWKPTFASQIQIIQHVNLVYVQCQTLLH